MKQLQVTRQRQETMTEKHTSSSAYKPCSGSRVVISPTPQGKVHVFYKPLLWHDCINSNGWFTKLHQAGLNSVLHLCFYILLHSSQLPRAITRHSESPLPLLAWNPKIWHPLHGGNQHLSSHPPWQQPPRGRGLLNRRTKQKKDWEVREEAWYWGLFWTRQISE